MTATPEVNDKLQELQALLQQPLPKWFTTEEWHEVQAIILKYDQGGAVDALIEHRFLDVRQHMSKYFEEPRETFLMRQYMGEVQQLINRQRR